MSPFSPLDSRVIPVRVRRPSGLSTSTSLWSPVMVSIPIPPFFLVETTLPFEPTRTWPRTASCNRSQTTRAKQLGFAEYSVSRGGDYDGAGIDGAQVPQARPFDAMRGVHVFGMVDTNSRRGWMYASGRSRLRGRTLLRLLPPGAM